jgi:transcription termination/antitermination protein NusA
VDIKSETEFSQQEEEIEIEGAEEVDGRCAAVLSAGRRCPNASLPGSRYCGLPQHQALARFDTNQVTVLAALSQDEVATLADSDADEAQVRALIERAEAEFAEEEVAAEEAAEEEQAEAEAQASEEDVSAGAEDAEPEAQPAGPEAEEAEPETEETEPETEETEPETQETEGDEQPAGLDSVQATPSAPRES